MNSTVYKMRSDDLSLRHASISKNFARGESKY